MEMETKFFKKLLNQKLFKSSVLEIKISDSLITFTCGKIQFVEIGNFEIGNCFLTCKATEIKKIISKIKSKKIEIGFDSKKNLTLGFKTFDTIKLPQDHKNDNYNFMENSEKIVLNAKQLQEGIKKTLFCISQDPTRNALTCVMVFLDKHNKIKSLTATNGHKFVLTNSNNMEELKELYSKDSYILLNETLCKFILNLELVQAYIFINKEKSKICIFDNKISIYDNLEIHYPNIFNAIPKNENSIVIDYSRFYTILNSVLPFTHEKTKFFILSFDKENSKLNIIVNGKIYDRIDCNFENSKNNINKLAFNCQFLIELLKDYKKETLEIFYNSEISAVTFYDSDLKLIMPLRIFEEKKIEEEEFNK